MVRPARVLFQPVHFIPESWNGIDEHLYLLAKHLDSARFELMVLEHDVDGPQTGELAGRAGLGVLKAPYESGTSAISRLRLLRRLYRDQGIDLVHIHSPAAGGQAPAAIAARLAGCIAAVTYHQIQPWRAPLRTRAINRFVHSIIVNQSIAVSDGVKDTLGSNAGVSASRVLVVHNGIEIEQLPKPRAMSPEKGVGEMIQALAPVLHDCQQVDAWIVGDGPQRPALEALTWDLGVSERIKFLGYRSDARALMSDVDVVVHVPEYEGFGLVVLEAMSAGRPVVVNDSPGALSEIVVAGETGMVVPSGDGQALAEAIRQLVNNPGERDRLGGRGRARCAEHFSARVMAQRTMAIYDGLLAGRGVQGRQP
jgi:glycosyltransferase involved in cell wall biosynthesis